MQPLSKLANFFKSDKKKALDLSEFTLDRVGWRDISFGDTLGHHYKNKDNQYENGYSSITKIANRFARALPEGIDENGEVDNSGNVMSRVYYPNDTMSGYDFREALMVMYLVHSEFYIIVHTKGDQEPNADNITGFTFFEGKVTINPETKKREYRYKDGTLANADRIIPIGGFNPYNVTRGYSPSQAAKKWTRLDDLIAEYQTGFFANGAVPAGQFVIRTKTAKQFNQIVTQLQEKHRGAGNNNNVSYAHEPLDETGKPQGAQIEWIPFNQSNKDLSMADLFEQANKKIDSVYGVPASIRAVNDNNTYASVRVDQQIFIEETVQPLTNKVWGRFTFGLNKMTGGIGISIFAEIPVPNIADEEKVIAEKKKLEGELIVSMLTAGFTLDGIVKGFELDEQLLELGEPNPQSDQVNDEVIEPNDMATAPEQKKLEVCDHSHEEPKKKDISQADYDKYTSAIASLARTQLAKQVNQSISSLSDELSKAYGDTTQEEDESFARELLKTLTPLLLIYGVIQNRKGRDLLTQAGLSVDQVLGFNPTPAQTKQFQNYLNKIATYFNEQTAQSIRNVVARGKAEGLAINEIKNNLRTIIDDEYRIRRIAVSEVNRTQGRASVDSMQNIARDTGYSIYKVWRHGLSDTPCPFCKAMLGTRVKVGESFIDLGTAFTGEDGSVLVNNFVSMETADMHPFCHCDVYYEVE